MAYKCIFFDLDHTLWDYETNSQDTLHDLYAHFELAGRGVPSVPHLCDVFRETNLRLWDLYDRGEANAEVIREQRFLQVLAAFDITDPQLAEQISAEYLRTCPARTKLMPHALEVLTYLAERYRLTIVTNGFEDVQRIKMAAGNLNDFFDHVITSQKAGYKKPARQIFDYALAQNNMGAHEVIMVGDNLMTDIGGARNVAIDTAYFNPDKTQHAETVTYEVNCLKELRTFL